MTLEEIKNHLRQGAVIRTPEPTYRRTFRKILCPKTGPRETLKDHQFENLMKEKFIVLKEWSDIGTYVINTVSLIDSF